MKEALTYAITSIVLSGGFYALFRAFLQGERAFALNRAALWGLILLSLALPALGFTDIFTVSESTPLVPRESVTKVVGKSVDRNLRLSAAHATIETASQEASHARLINPVLQKSYVPKEEFQFERLALYIYLLIFLGLLGRLFFGLWRIKRITSGGVLYRFPGYRVCFVTDNLSPFSFWKTIYLPRGAYSEEELSQIVLHERAHIEKFHFVDLILLELLCAVAWFNPLLRLFKNSAIELHEYSADRATLSSGVSGREYRAILYKNLTGEKLFAPSHYLNRVQIQRRLRMMSKDSAKRLALWKYAIVFSAAAILSVAFSCSEARINPKSYKDAEAMHVFLTSDFDYDIAPGDKAPQFPGGEKALEDYLLKDSLLRAIAAMDDNSLELSVDFIITDRGWAQYPYEFSINKDDERYTGKRWDLGTVMAKLVKELPQFEPALRQGKNVAAQMRMLVNFSQLNQHPHALYDNASRPDKAPLYPGSLADFQNYIKKNLRFPEEAKRRGIIGKFNVAFTVEADGRITNPEIASYKLINDVWGYGPTFGCDSEAIRLAAAMPRWKPALKDGKPTRSVALIPVMFGDEHKWYARSDVRAVILPKAPPEASGTEKAVNDYMHKYDVFSIKPEWGGEYFSRIVQKRIKYPDSQRNNSGPYSVTAKFTVNGRGEIVNPEIMGSFNNDFANEALRAIRTLEPVKPVILSSGAAVEYDVILFVKFRV